MSSVKQEVAAILMDYTDKIPDDVYMGILTQLSAIPDHKDLKKASEIQKELNITQDKLSIETDRNYVLLDEIEYLNSQLYKAVRLFEVERRSKKFLKERYMYIYRRVIWLEQMCEQMYEKTKILNNSRLLSENEYLLHGFDVIHKDDNTKQTEKIIQSLSSLFDTEDELEEEEREKEEEVESGFDKMYLENDSYYLDKLFDKLDNIEYGYYKYVSSTWWNESRMSRWTYYLLNGYEVTYYNEWEYHNYYNNYDYENDTNNYENDTNNYENGTANNYVNYNQNNEINNRINSLTEQINSIITSRYTF